MAERPRQIAPVTVGFLMRSGRAYQEQGNIHQATLAYLDIIDRYPGGKEAHEARNRLRKIAQEYEESGQPHMADHLYRRIDHTNRA